MEICTVKRCQWFTQTVWWLCFLAFPAQGAFTSMYVFGDGVCTTTNGPGGSTNYCGKSFTNGRVWVEVLAQRQGLAYNPTNNWSYFGHYSGNMVTNVGRFTLPSGGNSALFIIWVNDADFVWNVDYYGTNLTQWTKAMNQSITNHYKAITNLYYAKGARTLIMPNAVDLSKVPYYSGLPAGERSFIRQRIMDFNASFLLTLDRAKAALPGLTIYAPDFFSQLDQILAQPAVYGLVNPGIDAMEDRALTDKSTNGPGASYVFWDYLNPTAKTHVVMADLVQQMISPPMITKLTSLATSNRLDLANVPVGRNGSVLGSGDLLNWTKVQDILSTSLLQAVFVPVASSAQFYRLQFPAWSYDSTNSSRAVFAPLASSP
jgi:phospholipase/lecithinase/hemolysin